MNIETITILTVFVPIIGSLTIPVAGLISKSFRSFWSVILGLATAIFPLLLIPFALSGNSHIFGRALVMGMDFYLVVDGLSVFMSIVSSFIGMLIVLYSVGYVSHDENQSEYYLMVLLFIGSMMGLVYSANLIFMYLFWEITAICSWRLVGFYRDKIHILKADKTFLVTFGGAVFMLFGFIQIYGYTNTFNVFDMRGAIIPGSAVLLILIGMFAKSATVPIQTWLPDAGVAPSTVTALLHAAVLVKIGVYAYARIFNYTFTMPAGWQVAIPILAVISSLVAAGAATVENDLKRILAYSTVSQIGYIFLGLSVMEPTAITGAILYLLMHGLAKAGLFLCAGIIEHNTHTKDIRQLGGLIKTMPLTAIAFLISAFSVIGIPPLGGFFSKFMVILGTVKSGNLWLAAIALFTAVMTAFYLFRVFHMVFLGEAKIQAKEGTNSMLFVVVVLAILSILAGIFIAYPMKLANIATTQILGGGL
ncbi:MAG: NADH-quinone oxidoreductase subunit 5 family protein [bacterium]